MLSDSHGYRVNAIVTPAEEPQVHGQGPGRVSLSDSSGTGGEKSDSYQVFPDYSQLVPDRTSEAVDMTRAASPQLTVLPISHIMSTQVRRVHLMNHAAPDIPSPAASDQDDQKASTATAYGTCTRFGRLRSGATVATRVREASFHDGPTSADVVMIQ